MKRVGLFSKSSPKESNVGDLHAGYCQKRLSMNALTRLRSIRYSRLYAGALGHALAVLGEWRLERQVKGCAELQVRRERRDSSSNWIRHTPKPSCVDATVSNVSKHEAKFRFCAEGKQ
jgi:hypothetical protein